VPRTLLSRPEMGGVFSGDSNLQPRRKTERYQQRGFPKTWSGPVNADRLYFLAGSIQSGFFVSQLLFIISNKDYQTSEKALT